METMPHRKPATMPFGTRRYAHTSHPIRRILLIGHTHHDVGYTNSPRIADHLHAKAVLQVVDLCEAYGTPGPDQFRWTFEVARPVHRFLESASAADAERLRRLAADGRVAVTAGYLNLTQPYPQRTQQPD
jgi:hypothetical protein